MAAVEQAKVKFTARTKTFEDSKTAAETELKQENPDLRKLKALFTRVKRAAERALEMSESYIDLIVKQTPTPTDEINDAENQQSLLVESSDLILLELEEVIATEKIKDDEEVVHVPATTTKGTHHRLPKLELPKFGGDARDWLQFWSSFKTIHDDGAIPTTHKFQYLLNCMKEESTAEEMVKGYPITAANYGEVITTLKERFGRDDMLVEVYVRDIISLIMENAARKTESSFSSLYVKLSSQLRSLGTLGVTTDKCAAILYPMVESALPEDVFVAWERYRTQTVTTANTSEKHLEELMKFLKNEVEGNERIRLARESFSTTTAPTSKKHDKKEKHAVATASSLSNDAKPTGCVFCGGKHNSEACCKAMSMSLEERRNLIREKKACYNCLKYGHQSKKCKAMVKCVCCGNKHWAILCPELAAKNSEKESKTDDNIKTTKSTDMNNQVEVTDVLLQTIVVQIQGKKKTKLVRAMLDSGSSKSYVLQETAEEVGLKKIDEESVVHLLFGGIQTKPQRHNRYKVYLSDVDSTFHCNFDVSDSKTITAPISNALGGNWHLELKKKGVNINQQHKSTVIELLIGSDVYGRLLTGNKIDLDSGPTAIETRLGWTVSGKVYQHTVAGETQSAISCHLSDLRIQDLWDLDLIGIHEPMKDKSKEELAQAAVHHFKKTVTRNQDGRYSVRLPFVEGHQPLPSYRAIAANRLKSTKERVQKQGVLEAYHGVFMSWEEEGIIERVNSGSGHYLTHHGVIKPESLTTPVRPVFNGSFKTKGNPTLNECLEVGPNMLEEIPAIITRFRLKPVGITSDIRKAFLQIEVAEEDRDYLRFMWYADSSFTLPQEFRHRRVVFGVSSSPFLLAATLDHHLSYVEERHVNTAVLLKKTFYVDNCVASVSTIQEALKFKEESVQILQQAMMDLRGWEIGPGPEKKQVPILGLTWELQSDKLCCDIRNTMKKMKEGKVSKRRILSVAHSIFDPIGFTCPFTIVPKMLLQETCKLKVGWDAELPEGIQRQFLSWCDQIPEVASIQVPRFVAASEDRSTWSLHIFTDASCSAYSSCAYLRSGVPGQVTVQLLLAPARVAPLKGWTIPRLELIGCLCGARMAKSVREMIEDESLPVTFWTDSTTALAWIQNEKNCSRFVAARVNEIRQLSKIDEWKHVPGKLNPADVPSRGSTVKHLIDNKWWEGPVWLRLDEEDWPTSPGIKLNEEEINEELKKTVISHVNIEKNSLLGRLNVSSDFHKIVRVVAYCRRFIAAFQKRWTPAKSQEKPTLGPLSFEEFQNAKLKLLKLIQAVNFTGTNDEKLKNLRVFVDEDGLIRLKTRLFPGEEKGYSTPTVLPARDPTVRKLIWKNHIGSSHAGVNALMAQLREECWILKSRCTIRSVIHSCSKCRRFQSRPAEVEVGPLPKDRQTLGEAFDVIGVDMAGPLFLKGNKKVWIAIFTCAVTRGIHLELCSKLSTEIFLAAFRRFVARRGRPSTVYSDNGLNFVGTANLLKAVDWSKIQDYANISNIHWKFNPPTAAWWGGFWERMIGIVKQMLRAVLGASRVNNEELYTLLCDVESVVNSRPLTYINEENELKPLTPNLFIRNCGLSCLPDVDAIERDHFVVRFKNILQCRDELRSRFRKDGKSILPC